MLLSSVLAAATSAQAVQVAVCPCTRFCKRGKLQKQPSQHASSPVKRRSQQHITRALQKEVDKPATQRKRGKKKETKPPLPNVRVLTFCLDELLSNFGFTEYTELHCSLPTSNRQSRTRSLSVVSGCTLVNMVCFHCASALARCLQPAWQVLLVRPYLLYCSLHKSTACSC